MNYPPENIKKTVLEKIRRGDIHMRPRIYFIVQIITVLIVAGLTLIASALVVSFAFFSIHESGELFLLGFGGRGLVTFLELFPWITLAVTIGLVLLLEWLLSRFKFNYRIPTLKILAIGLALIFIIGLLLNTTTLHSNLMNKADKGELPIFGELYESIRMPHEDKGEFRGVVVAVSATTLTITHNDRDADADDGTRVVLVPPGFETSQFKVGDRVYVAGNALTSTASDTISAYGLEKF